MVVKIGSLLEAGRISVKKPNTSFHGFDTFLLVTQDVNKYNKSHKFERDTRFAWLAMCHVSEFKNIGFELVTWRRAS